MGTDLMHAVVMRPDARQCLQLKATQDSARQSQAVQWQSRERVAFWSRCTDP